MVVLFIVRLLESTGEGNWKREIRAVVTLSNTQRDQTIEATDRSRFQLEGGGVDVVVVMEDPGVKYDWMAGR